MKNYYFTFDRKPLLRKTLQECNIKKYDMIIMTSQHEVYDDPQHDTGSVNSINYSDSVLIIVLDPPDMF